MRNKNKIALLLVACSLICSVAVAGGCNEKGNGNSAGFERQEDNLTVETAIYNKKVGETDFVVPMGYTAAEGVHLVFVSSNSDVVSVNQYGEFTANKEGTATITVTYGSASAQAIVNVGWGGENPRIRMNQTIETTGELKLAGTTPFDLGLWVYYNAKKWNDATYEYTLSDPSVGSIVNGCFVPAKNGTTTVSVKATWRDKTCSSMETSFTVTISDDVELSINNGFGGTIELYTRETVGNATFATSSPFVITANKNENGVSVSLPVSVEISDGGEDIIEYDETNQVIRAKGIAGEVLVNVSCEVDGEIYTVASKVIVSVSVGDYVGTEKVEFSAMDGLFFVNGEVFTASDIFGESSATLVSASVDGAELMVNQNAVLGLKTPNKETLETTITVKSASVGYRIPVTAYAKIIDSAEDLSVFCLDVTNYGVSNNPKSIEGYYVLAGDIDASKYAMQTQGYLLKEADVQSGGFKGVFDGRGYVISDITFGYDLQLSAETRTYWNHNDYSLFGVIASGAVVKNFALTNVKYDIRNTGGGGNINASKCSPLAGWIMAGATVENAYISTESINRIDLNYTYINGFAWEVKLGANLKNIIVNDTNFKVLEEGKDASAINYRGSFALRRNVNDKTTENNWSNVIVISENKCTYNYPDAAYDASNITSEAGSSFMTMPNIYRYKTFQEFIKANDVDYTKFGDVWDKSGYVPVWNDMSLEDYLVIEFDGKPSDRFEIDSTKVSEVTVTVSANKQDCVMLKSMSVDGDSVTYINGKLTANNPGQSVLTAVITYNDKEYELKATVDVVADLQKYAETVEFSVMHGTLPIAEIFGNVNTEIVLAYQGNKKLTVTDNKITGVVLTEKDKAETIELTVYSQDKGYKVTCNAYAGIISKAEDLEVFNLQMNYEKLLSYQTTDAGRGLAVKEQMPILTGYYVLAGNIDATAYKMNTQGIISGTYATAMKTRGFQGTFDGRGYTISGLTLGNNNFDDVTNRTASTWGWTNNTYSLFGVIGEKAVVKNFALTDVVFDLNNYGTGGVIASALCSPIATWVTDGATIENVYVSVKGITRFNASYTTMTGFAYGVDVGATLKNIVVDDTATEIGGNGLTSASTIVRRGSFVYRKMASQSTTANSWMNVVVISTKPLSYYKGTEQYPGYAYDASNVAVGDYVDYTSYVNMPNTYRYESVEALETAQADTNITNKPSVADFATTYWHLVDGVPIWGKEKN